ncbi:MAG TPA: GFA family protein [Parvularculaceae bacterium]|nr:GFA family protein [Parvularculaceae bacterium]
MTKLIGAPFEGGCACGGVRFAMTSGPMFIHCCHCTWCQRETGSAFALNALIETARLDLLKGAPMVVPTPSASGKGQKILRCPECRVALWSHYPGAGEAIAFMRVGTLDGRAHFKPDIHIFTSTKLPWVVIPPDVAAVEEYYSAQEHWPAASLERRRAAAAQAPKR